jgi:archaellum component FlaF (FlaF/FlaG flagellin family)
MLTAVTVMGTGAVAWSNTKLFTNEQVIATTYSSNVNKIQERLSIENIWFCMSCYQGQISHGLNVTLTNTGNLALNVTQIKINNATYVYPISNILIFPGKSSSWQQNYNWQSKIPINIYVTTARGSIFTTQAAAP